MGFNILIVDDDQLVVEKLVHGIGWEGIGIDTVFTAKNIRQAKQILGKVYVDILLSDIEMPQGSGLELLEWVRSEGIPCECIFLSSYAYFGYAQKAVNLGAANYILKPALNKEISETLNGIVEQLKKKKGKTEKTQVAFWERYLHQEIITDSFLEWMEKEVSCRMEDEICLCILRIFPGVERRQRENATLYHFVIQNITEEFWKERAKEKLICFVRRSDDEWFLMLDKMDEYFLSEELAEYKVSLEKALSMKCCIYVGESKRIKDLFPERKMLEWMEREAVVGVSGILVKKDWLKKSEAKMNPPWQEWERVMEDDNDKKLENLLLSFIQKSWEEYRLTVSMLEGFKKELLSTVYRYMNRQNRFMGLFEDEQFDECYRKAAYTLGDMEEFIFHVCGKLSCYKHQSNHQEFVVEQIKTYIHMNLKEDLTRKRLAGIVFLSEDYLSKLFMNITGTSLPNYISTCRMKKAQEYLERTDLTVNKIATEVGFSNFSYFSKVFRDYCGQTPNEFRSSKKRERNGY